MVHFSARIFGCMPWLAVAATASALPPLGLTPVGDTSTRGRLAVIDGVAYVSTAGRVIPIASEGVGAEIVPTLPANNANLLSLTRVVPGPGGAPYVASEYLAEPDAFGAEEYHVAWHSLADPATPVAQQQLPSDILRTDGYTHLRGVDSNLRVLIESGFGHWYETRPDVPSRSLQVVGTDFLLGVYDVATNGFSGVSAAVPGTIGSAGALLSPDGQIEFLDSYGSINSIRVNESGSLNVSYWSDRLYVRYGDEPPLGIDASIGSRVGLDTWTLVSESRFAVVADNDDRGDLDHRAFFPGISEEGLDRSIGLEEAFPELASLGRYDVRDLSSHDQQIHLLLSNDAGLWLFAAPDPSLIPEPIALGSISLATLAALGGLRRDR